MKRTLIIIGLIILLLSVGYLSLKFFWIKEGISIETDKKFQSYSSVNGSLNFLYSINSKLTESTLDEEGNIKTILVEDKENQKGFEIIIIPFDEEGVISSERILTDIPDMKIINDKKIFIGNNIEALEFESEDDNIGQTYEVWFVNKKYLYQVRTYAENKNELNEILKTFKLN